MKIHKYTLLALSAFLLAAVSAGCSDDIDAPSVPDAAPDCFNIAVSVPLNTPSRAASDDLNEYKVNSLHLFFYTATEHNDDVDEYLFHYVTTESFEFSKSLRISLPADALLPGGLFGETASECLVYAVANVDEALLTGRTVSALKASALSSEFDRTIVQPAFAMDGLARLSLDRDNRSVSGDIKLQRAAAKLTLSIALPESIDVTETVINPQDGTEREVERTYFPNSELMHVWMGNGVKTSVLNTAPTPAPAGCLYSNDISIAEGVGSSFSESFGLPDFPYTQSVPFYSFPNAWDPSIPAGNSHLTLVVPWHYVDDQGNIHNLPTYYRIAVQPLAHRIERNTHYDMRVNISRLGSSSILTPIELSAEWSYVLPWNTQGFQTDIREIRYLLLNSNDFDAAASAFTYTMNNETEIAIPYTSSHKVTITKATIKWRDYLNDEDRTITLKTTGDYTYSSFADYVPDKYFAAIELDHENSTLKLKRDLRHLEWSNNKANISKNPAFNADTIDITLSHELFATQSANVRIIQLPAIYITSQANTKSGHRFVNNNNTKTDNGLGYVEGNNTDSDLYLGALDVDDNMHTYIINISRFDENSKYIIGDPRSRVVDNIIVEGTWSVSSSVANSESNDTRPLTYYYPTTSTGTNTRNFIAPRLRIASQWGVTRVVTRKGAMRRCASYQENGRPAGRWRLPTVAEIEYIANLSSKKYIPYLFGNQLDSNIIYWCGTGAVKVNNRGNSVSIDDHATGRNFVRCVYDEWYWGNDTLTNKDEFRWGDRPRSSSGNL